VRSLERRRYFRCRRVVFGLLVFSGACSSGTVDAPAVPDDLSASVDLAFAGGVRYATEKRRQPFVWPTFVHGFTTPRVALSRQDQRVLTEAFARGENGALVPDTVAWQEGRGGHPQNAVVTITNIVLRADSGFVWIIEGGVSSSGSYDATEFRYTFVRVGRVWQFIRRQMTGAS
jgi:hypothetical protein